MSAEMYGLYSDEELDRLEHTLALHAYYVYRCEGCELYFGRYIEEDRGVCPFCGCEDSKHLTTLEPGNFLIARLNGGVNRKQEVLAL